MDNKKNTGEHDGKFSGEATKNEVSRARPVKTWGLRGLKQQTWGQFVNPPSEANTGMEHVDSWFAERRS